MSGVKRYQSQHSVFGVLLAGAFALGLMADGAVAQEKLPDRLANDPVAKALGAKIVNAAIKEGKVVWYGGNTGQDFLDGGGRERFEKRFGIKVEIVSGRLRGMTDRIRTEAAVGRLTADVYEANDQYMLELQDLGLLEKWRPPAPVLNEMPKEVFVREPAGYWWPVHLSAQALVVNTDMVKPDDYPKSYWDIIDPKWKGKVAIRDPRSSGGGAWHMMHIYSVKSLGLDYIKKLKETVSPFIMRGGSRRIRGAIARGQFALAFSGRGEFIRDLPKGAPVKYIVPKEGMAWTPSSITLLKGAPHPNAGKLSITWFYELENLQLWTEHGRPVPHPKIKTPIPEMSVTDYPLMEKIPEKWLGDPNFFFKEME
ncbi:MAG TPA: extracellular solute-binding protein, partial [Alphaproteobacteria bacterium]|nr:extracellular solute-binding protein [Alphaproteobacteria bacterium]